MNINDTSGADLDLNRYFLGFTPSHLFRRKPRLFVRAEGNYLFGDGGQRVFDGFSGLWCSGMGHCHPHIAAAVSKQISTLDYVAAFNMSHPAAFKLAERIAKLAPEGLEHVFFTCTGSDSVDTALKLAIGYHKLRGDAGRYRIVGRERGYHGVGFGGLSAGGMVANRQLFGSLMLPGVDHLPHTHSLEDMAFSRGQPQWGAHLADELERMVELHGSTIAAVIVEPMAGSTGVLVPPVGYLQRLRELCNKHGILLIFDEVICGFGRMGAAFGAERFGVTPDMITFAKTVTNGTQPLGGVIIDSDIHETFMEQPDIRASIYHGYTYSAHPVAVAAGLASLDVLENEGLIARVRELEPAFEERMHSLASEPGVIDVRNIGLAAGIQFEPWPDRPTQRGYAVAEALLDAGFYARWCGDQITVAPPFTSSVDELDAMTEALRTVLRAHTAPQ